MLKLSFIAGMLLLLTTMTSCAAGTVSLHYQYPPGRVSTYHWAVDADTTSAGDVTHTLHLEASIREEVSARKPGGAARMHVTLQPAAALQDGRAVSTGPPIEFDLDVDATGSVKGLGTSASVSPAAAGSLGLDRLLVESQPPVAGTPLRLRDRWPADLSLSGTAGSLDLHGSGTLEGFGLRGGRRLAQLSIRRRGRAAASPDLTGTATDSASIEFDIDRGLILDATTQATSVLSPGAGPVRSVVTSNLVLTRVSS